MTGRSFRRKSKSLSRVVDLAWQPRDSRFVVHVVYHAHTDYSCFQVVLKVIMLRRIKEGLVLSFPPKTVTVVQCHFDAVERDFYDTFAHKLRARLRELKGLTTEKQWCPLMVMLLRLRQGLL